MIRLLNFALIICIIWVSFTACRLTRSDVIGKWEGKPDGSVIIINGDNSFQFFKDHSLNKTGDSSAKAIGGRWALEKNAIHFFFTDSAQSFGGGCDKYSHWWTRSSKRSLIRPDQCNSPAHRFNVITKIN
jgi:hypothetical protein